MVSPTSAKSAADLAGRRLSRAPLIRVLCQIRWQKLSKFDLSSVADKYALLIGDDYLLRDTQQELQFTLTPNGVTQQVAGEIHRFQTADLAWTLSLGEQFLALETSRYDGHEGFIQRLTSAATHLASVARIPFLIRVGYRYTNRLTDSTDIADLGQLFDSSILGGLAHGDISELRRTVSESLYAGDSNLLVRSALLEPNMTIDPAIPPVETQSWILDLDSYREAPASMEINSLGSLATELSERAGGHFKSVITPAFIARFE